MNRALAALRTAFGYFSIVPIGSKTLEPAPDAAALLALPVVGAAVGGISGTAAWLVSRIAPRPYVVATAFALPIVLTGAIHVDGFLDCSDAIFATTSPQRRLEIMKDPRHGTYAIAAFAVANAFGFAALAGCRPSRLPLALASACALSRLSAITNAFVIPYARTSSVPRAFVSKPSRVVLGVEIAVALAVSSRVAPRAPLAFAAAFVAAAVAARTIATRLGGGLTGDAYGFLIVALEPAILAAIVSPEARDSGT